MKLRWKIIIAVFLFFSVLLPVLFYSCFTPTFSNCVAEITLVKNKTVKHKAIRPMRLLSVDLVQKTVEIEVEYPTMNGRNFMGKKIQGLMTSVVLLAKLKRIKLKFQ